MRSLSLESPWDSDPCTKGGSFRVKQSGIVARIVLRECYTTLYDFRPSPGCNTAP